MKYGFVTCVQLGLSCIEAIYEIGGTLDLIITLNDEQAISKSGRIYLDQFCAEHDVELFKSSHINNSECVEKIKEKDLDWLFIIGWSQIANAEVINAPKLGALGMHPTLLPQGRGRAAIPWAILKELPKTGVTLFKLDTGVDTGEIAEQIEIPLSKETNATELYHSVCLAHEQLIKSAYVKLQAGKLVLKPQDDGKETYWPERKPEDGAIDLNGSVYDAEKLIRAVTKPYPGAYFINDKNQKVIVWQASIVSEKKMTNCLSFIDGYLSLDDFTIAGYD